MRLLIPREIIRQLIDATTGAGQREIGGILMGEHVGTDTFRIKSLTIQRNGGTFATFLRIISEFMGPLRAFFDKTKHEYSRYNYLGEWHSHHSFDLSPSRRDHLTMYEIVTDPAVGAHFAVLLLVKVTGDRLENSVIVYQSHQEPFEGEVFQEDSI